MSRIDSVTNPPSNVSEQPSALLLRAAYLASFGALAASSPFLAVNLASRGLRAEAVAQVLAAMVLVRVVATSAGTLLADRLGSVVTVLRLASLMALVAFAPLAGDLPAEVLLVSLVAFSAARAPFASLVDTLVLRGRASAFGSIRALGTLGYAVGVAAMGALVQRFGPRIVVDATIPLLVLVAIVAFAIPRAPSPPVRTHATGGLSVLARRPRFLLLLAVAALHEVGLAPYEALFPAYLTAMTGARFAGVAVAVGTTCEFVFMFGSGPIVRRLGSGRLLFMACVASVVRWSVIAYVTTPAILACVQALHAFVFGAFYVAAVTIVHEECPPMVRASGQGLFSALCFGVFGAMAVSLAGVVGRLFGFRSVFAVAACASALAAIIAGCMGRERSLLGRLPAS